MKRNQPVEVNVLFQDRVGFLWFGTDKGLFRFDGSDYKQFTSSDSLVGNDVTAVAEDSLGRLWIGHRDGQISYLENGILHPFESREGNAVEPISDIVFDARGIMWFSTLNDGLYYFRNDRLYRVDEDEGLPDLFIYDLFVDGDGAVWAGTDAGIAICSIVSGQVQISVIDADDGLSDIIIKKIERINDDIIGVATEDAGMLTINRLSGEIKPLIKSPWLHGPIADFAVKEKQVWVAAPRSGLVVCDVDTDLTKLYRSFNGQPLLSINTLIKDREGSIWSGSKSGLSRTIGDALEHLEVLQTGKDNNVLALAIDDNDRMWFSTSEGLFVREVRPDGSAVVTRELDNTPFRDSPVISLYSDRRGYIWAGFYGDGLLRIHPGRNEIRHIQDELRNGNILSITGRGGTIWVATLGGSSSIRSEDDKFVVENFSSADGLSSDFVYQVFIDSQGRKWFATDGKGVTMLDQTGFHQYQDGLPSKVVYSIAEDSNKDIWVSAQDNGVLRFDKNQFVRVPELRLRDNAIHALVADADGNLMAMHNYGIDVYDVNRRQMRYWGEETGIRDKQPNLNAVTRDADGRIFIGTTKGVMQFSLRNDHTISSPQPVIDGFSIFGQDVNIHDNLRLKHDENNITIRYLGFWFQNAGNVSYQYKLENYDLEWIATRNQEVTYSRLPAGDYTFKVKVSETDDFSNGMEASVSFSIRQPFWKTWPFYGLVIAVFLITAFGVVKYRERKFIEDNLVLEARVEERTREIQLKTEEIQAQNEEIMAQAEEIQGINENLEMLVQQRTAELERKNKALEEYAFINAHKLRSPVASILGLVNLLAKADQNDDASVIREHLQQSADKLDDVVRSITKAIEKADDRYL